MSISTSTTRRGFIAGAATAGIAAAGMSASAAFADEAVAGVNDAPESWDLETDVVVMGYGYAAMASAISAAVEGSQVQVFEKAPEEEAGGNSAVCCGYFNLVAGEGAFDYWKALADGGVSDEECQAVADATEAMPEWFNANVIESDITANEEDKATKTFNGVKYPNAGSTAMSIHLEGVDPNVFVGWGNAMWKQIDGVIRDRYADSITLNFASPITHLIFDPQTKEVKGVRVEQNGAEICVKANKGVIMACGGYEANYDMVKDFVMPFYEQFHIGSPYNTGDGIVMLNEIGGKLRHLAAVEYGSPCCLELSRQYQQGIPTHNGGDCTHMVYINKHGQRFMNEDGYWPAHDKRYPYPCFNQAKPSLEVSNYPWWMVFDETRRTKGTLFAWSNPGRNEGWAAVRNVYQWSDDNQAEVDMGVVLKADTFEELGGLMGFEGEDLTAFVDQMNAYNENGTAGEDPEFGRTPNADEDSGLGMTCADGPFYAVQVGLSYLNTNGGGDRSVDYQIKDWNGNVIPRLYEAGEFGSIFYHYYSGGGNICEAFTSGMKCGQNVSALEPQA